MYIQNYLSCNCCHLRCAFRNWSWRPRGPRGSRRPRGSRKVTCRRLAGKVRFCTTGKGKLETWALTTWKVGFQKHFLLFTLFYWKEKNKQTIKQPPHKTKHKTQTKQTRQYYWAKHLITNHFTVRKKGLIVYVQPGKARHHRLYYYTT